MKCGATPRHPCPGRCQRCMMGKSHIGMTTNGVKCPEGVGQLFMISRSKSKEGVATKDRPLGSGVRSVCFALHRYTNARNKTRTCFVLLRKNRPPCAHRTSHLTSSDTIALCAPAQTRTTHTEFAQHESSTDTRHRTPDRHSHCFRQLPETLDEVHI